MSFLHPDKIVGMNKAIGAKPAVKMDSIEHAAIKSHALAPAPLRPHASGLVANLAFHMRDRQYNRHLGRITGRFLNGPHLGLNHNAGHHGIMDYGQDRNPYNDKPASTPIHGGPDAGRPVNPGETRVPSYEPNPIQRVDLLFNGG